jgi:hypothetical protein
MENKETVNQEATTNEKTFTQTELDAIVSERLKRERAKYEGYEDLKAKADKLDAIEEASKTELQKAMEKAHSLETELNSLKKAESVRLIREKVAKETGIPMASMSLLTGETEEACQEQAKAILAIAQPNTSYPQLKDGGELTTTMKSSTRQQFAEWANQAFN